MTSPIDLIESAWLASQTRSLVETPSVTMDEAAVCAQFASLMSEVGLVVDVREVTPGRNNLYAKIPGTGEGPALLFNGHLDTIPIGYCVAPGREGDVLAGRGTTDLYVNATGIPTFYYGPSNETAHSDNECVSVERLASAAKVYAEGAMRYCGVSD